MLPLSSTLEGMKPWIVHLGNRFWGKSGYSRGVEIGVSVPRDGAECVGVDICKCIPLITSLINSDCPPTSILGLLFDIDERQGLFRLIRLSGFASREVVAQRPLELVDKLDVALLWA
jgi:hypothetical protein